MIKLMTLELRLAVRKRTRKRERGRRALQPVGPPADKTIARLDSDKGSETRRPFRLGSKKADLRGRAGIESLGRPSDRLAITGATQFEYT